jgi:chorismate mutase
LLFDGLMLEVHPNPAVALSDSAQQLTPACFFELIKSLNLPHELSDSESFVGRLKALRRDVDDLDGRLLDLLSQRMAIVRKMGELKATQNVSTFQPDRWQKILADRIQKGELLDLSGDFVEQLMQTIHEEAIRQQEADRLSQ